jgi:hypothetical protein
MWTVSVSTLKSEPYKTKDVGYVSEDGSTRWTWTVASNPVVHTIVQKSERNPNGHPGRIELDISCDHASGKSFRKNKTFMFHIYLMLQHDYLWDIYLSFYTCQVKLMFFFPVCKHRMSSYTRDFFSM